MAYLIRTYQTRLFLKLFVRLLSPKRNSKSSSLSKLGPNAYFAVQLPHYVLTDVKAESISAFVALEAQLFCSAEKWFE
jgi:hypothetical protein